MSGHDALADAIIGRDNPSSPYVFCEVTDVTGLTVTVLYEGQPMTFGPERIYCDLPADGQIVIIAKNGQDRFIVGKRLA